MNEMQSAFESLLNFDKPFDQIDKKIDSLNPYLPDEHLVILTRQHVISVLQRYMQGLLNQDDLYLWDSKIIGWGDQIGYEKGYSDLLKGAIDYIDEFCEPDESFSAQEVQVLIDRLKNTPFDPLDD